MPGPECISARSPVWAACRAQSIAAVAEVARGLEREGIRYVFKLSTVEEVDSAAIERQPLWNNCKFEHGPFDIVGDVHGCIDELLELLSALGYLVETRDGQYAVQAPEGRKLIFVGDLVDRGPGTPEVLRLVSGLVRLVRLSVFPAITI